MSRPFETYSNRNLFFDTYTTTGEPRAVWINNPGGSYYTNYDVFRNITSGRIAGNEGNSAGVNIDIGTIYEDNYAGAKGVIYTKAWRIAKYIDITFTNNSWPAQGT